MAERVSILTEDGVELAGLWLSPPGAEAAVILLHMMPATKESWTGLMEALARKGIAALAIDLRGHGESTRRGDARLDFTEFDDAGHQAKRLDAEAAAAWVMKKGIPASRMAACGASIGANLAIRLLADRPEMPAAAALSPGRVYRGVDAMDGARRLSPGQKLFLAASDEDAYAYESVESLAEASRAGETQVERLSGLGHGTTMFEHDPAFLERTADWLAKRLV